MAAGNHTQEADGTRGINGGVQHEGQEGERGLGVRHDEIQQLGRTLMDMNRAWL